RDACPRDRPRSRISDRGKIMTTTRDTTHYHATAERDGAFWFITVPEVQRSTQARRASQVEATARDLIGIMTNRDPAAVTVDIAWRVAPAVEVHLARARELRATAVRANADAAEEARLAARGLADAGLGTTDIG